MLTFPKNRLSAQWDRLPMPLREAMYAPDISDTLWKICSEEHLSDEKTYIVAKIAGFVFMGLLSTDQTAKEIADELGIDIRVATATADAINQQIFAPLRSDIDNVYKLNMGTAAPKVFEEIRPPMAELMPTSTPAPAPISLTATSVAIPKSAPIPSTPTPTPAKAASFDEFSRIRTNKTAPPSPAAPVPKPVVLQTESIPRPILNAPNFKVPTISQDIMGGERGMGSLSQKAAVVEIGGTPMLKATPAAQVPATPKVTVVRFGSENSSAPLAPPKPEAARTITEITPESLKAAAPAPKEPPRPTFTPISQIPVPSPLAPKPQAASAPISSVPPKPMSQVPKPAPQPEKVIQKDYSEEKK